MLEVVAEVVEVGLLATRGGVEVGVGVGMGMGVGERRYKKKHKNLKK